jgi:hypothetical protein
VAQLLEDSAELSGCEDFAIRMAERRSFQSLGGLAAILERHTSLRGVVSTTRKLRRQLNDVFELDIVDGADQSFIQVSVLPHFAGRQATDLVTAMTHVLLRGASNGGWTPLAVYLNHQAPKEGARFERFFGAPVEFGTLTNGFHCDRQTLDRAWGGNPLVAAAELVSILEERIANLSQASASLEEVNDLKALLAEVAAEIGNIADSKH